MHVLILNGPNLNMLGTREPEIYGHGTLAELEAQCAAHAGKMGLSVTCFQSNAEAEIIDRIQHAREHVQAIIINAGALTHTSIALMDALKGCNLPVIEVHLSNIFQRETFRHHSYVSYAAIGFICGLGVQGYLLALQALKSHLKGE